MNSVFSKLFLSFWISLVLFVGLTLVVTSYYLDHTKSLDIDSDPRSRLRDLQKEAQRVAQTHGAEGLKAWIKKVDEREAVPYLLIDRHDKDILGREVNRHLLRKRPPPSARWSNERRSRSKGHHVVELVDGQIYRLIPDYRSVTLSRVLSRPRVIAIPLVIATLISILVSFFLARYFTRPLRKLSEATHHFASGEWSTRVAPELGKRKDEITSLANDFDSMAEKIQRLLDSHMRLLGDVSHELRSPLARLQVALGLIRQKNPQSMAELDRIELEAEQLNELIAQILTLSRLNAGTQPLRSQSIPLDKLLDEVLERIRYERQSDPEVINLVRSESIELEGDSSMIGSVLENVIRNAIKYSPLGKQVDVELFSRFANHDAKTCQAVVLVRDYGPGVPDEEINRIFEPFYRVGEARDRDSGGYGLGLAIARQFVSLHDGRMTASNCDDEGLMVEISLPVLSAG